MCTIQLSQLMKGKSYPDAGNVLYSEMCRAYRDNDSIVLDMNDVDILPSMFLNVSIGRLIKENGRIFLRSVIFKNIKKNQLEKLQDYISKIDV